MFQCSDHTGNFLVGVEDGLSIVFLQNLVPGVCLRSVSYTHLISLLHKSVIDDCCEKRKGRKSKVGQKVIGNHGEFITITIFKNYNTSTQ